MKRVSLITVLILSIIVVMSTSGAVLKGGGGYQVSQVADIYPGATSSAASYLTEYSGKLYFTANDGTHGYELWEYDGISSPKMTAEIWSGAGSGSPVDFAVFDGKLYFSANDGTHGRELWVYDGITSPSMVMDINPPSPGPDLGRIVVPSSNPQQFEVFQNKLYFQANTDANGAELWVYDGSNPPSMVNDILAGAAGSNPTFLTVFNNKLYFSATETTNGKELWVYEGVSAPSIALDIYPGANNSDPKFLTVLDSKLYFRADNGTNGDEPAMYDGVNPITVYDVRAGVVGSGPQAFTVFNNTLYFSANDSISGIELWKLTGSTPSMVADIISGSTGSLPNDMVVFNNKLVFTADNGSAGKELMQYDGSTSPVLVADINSGSGVSTPNYKIEFKDKLFFMANDGIDGFELWEYGPQTLQDLFYSQSTYDGWVLETAENTNQGGLLNTTNLICNIGDDALDRQYRTLLHFNTSRIPDNAHITKVTVQYKQHSTIGSDPYATHGVVWADIKDGFFSGNPGLVRSDFGAASSMNNAGLFSLYPSALAYPVYRTTLKSDALQYLNEAGSTQFRLRFGIDDDNDNTADYLKIFCGDMPVPFNRPNLRVWYYYDPD